jgi:hypothetical protein
MTPFRWTLLGVIVLLAVVGAAAYFNIVKHASRASKSNTYTIDLKFERVKKILSKTDTLEAIVEAQHGKLIDRKWHSLNISSEKLRSGWEVNGTAEFVVLTNHPETGQLRLRFAQRINITKTSLRSETVLMEPCGHIKGIATVLEMVPNGEQQTKVSVQSQIVYERKLPKQYVGYMDQRVNEAADKMLVKNQEVLTSHIEKYRDKKFIIPLKRK